MSINHLFRNFFFLLLLLSGCSGASNESVSLIERGNAAYEAGKYSEAKEIYKKVIETKGISNGLYYNLANTVYRESNYAEAVLYYKKALDLAPRDAESKANLELAREKLQIPDTHHQQNISSILVTPRVYLSEFECQILFLLSYLLFSSLFLCKSFAHRTFIGWSSFIASLIILPSAFFSVPIPNERYSFSITTSRDLGVILKAKVNVYAGNSKTFQVIHILSAGVQVIVTEKRGDWLQIVIGDSKGWVLSSDLGLVRSI